MQQCRIFFFVFNLLRFKMLDSLHLHNSDRQHSLISKNIIKGEHKQAEYDGGDDRTLWYHTQHMSQQWDNIIRDQPERALSKIWRNPPRAVPFMSTQYFSLSSKMEWKLVSKAKAFIRISFSRVVLLLCSWQKLFASTISSTCLSTAISMIF